MIILSEKRCNIGEGPIWNAAEETLYYVNAMDDEVCTYAQNGQEIFVLDSEKDLADTANRLLNDPNACETLGQAAAQFVRTHFSWDRAFEAFSKLNL